ncbi:hypothetical protein DH2020_047246 [Rehmannia glutinosa]|uniref:Uncharacterized protein n=1 Tax=Rehmannia glutinosa TaxID=99300 RepID=A0ABR0U9M8_REHGL
MMTTQRQLPPRVYVGYSVYKGKAALTAEPRSPEFSPLGSGAFKLSKEGFVLLQFAPATGVRQYDWGRKQVFSLSVTEIGNIISLGARDSCEFFHDPNKGRSDEGKVRKVLKVEPLPDGSGHFFNLSWHTFANTMKPEDANRVNSANPRSSVDLNGTDSGPEGGQLDARQKIGWLYTYNSWLLDDVEAIDVKTAKVKMDEVREENERLKLTLSQMMKDYNSLKMQFNDIIQEDDQLKKSTNLAPMAASDGDHASEFVSLSLGRFPGDHFRREEKKHSFNESKNQENSQLDGLKLGLDWKFQLGNNSIEISKNLRPESSSDESKEEGNNEIRAYHDDKSENFKKRR